MTERFKPIKPLPEDSMGVKSAEEKMVEQTKKTPKGAMKRVGKFKGGMLKGGQKKLDVNKDGKISGDDFAMLRGKKMVKASSGKIIADGVSKFQKFKEEFNKNIGAEEAEIVPDEGAFMGKTVERRRPLPTLQTEQSKPITPKERREKDIAKRAEKKMGGGMMMQDSMGYKRGGSVLVKTKLGRTKPTKMF